MTLLLVAVVAGALIGLSLGALGGGGSILAVPLMVYLVRVRDPHIAIGTSAFAVAANAAFGLFSHHRIGNVKWRCASVFAVSGIVGAAIGSTLGKAFDGQKLLFLFALVMVLVGVLMLRRRGHVGDAGVKLGQENAGKLVLFGFGTGLFSGFFGIGGGFLIGPALIAATGMPMLMAVGSSLVAVTAFGLTTAVNYAFSGLVDWPLAFLFVGGGFLGSFGGTRAAKHLSGKGQLTTIFSTLIFVVAAYMLWKSGQLLER